LGNFPVEPQLRRSHHENQLHPFATPLVSGEFAFFLHSIGTQNTKGACPQAAPFSLKFVYISILSILTRSTGKFPNYIFALQTSG
jgi:hypothetical protein